MHDHDHDHVHPHTHSGSPASAEETLAVLCYMSDHNKHHAEELHELAHGVPAEAAELLHAAVELYEKGTCQLDKAIALLKGE